MSLKSKIKNKQKTLGTWITIYHRSFVEIVADQGYDWACIDIEHSSIDLDQLATLISIGRGRELDILVRLSELNPTLIKRVMDSGATGIIVPMVNTVEQADLAFKSMHYPPAGIRGVGLSTAQKYGGQFDKYKTWLKNEAVLIVQVEHIDSINNLKNILDHKGVDGFLVGPYDLSASLGIPGEFEKPAFKEAMKKIEEVQKTVDKACGIHIVQPEVNLIKANLQKGFNFIAYSFETRLYEVEMKKAQAQFKNNL